MKGRRNKTEKLKDFWSPSCCIVPLAVVESRIILNGVCKSKWRRQRLRERQAKVYRSLGPWPAFYTAQGAMLLVDLRLLFAQKRFANLLSFVRPSVKVANFYKCFVAIL